MHVKKCVWRREKSACENISGTRFKMRREKRGCCVDSQKDPDNPSEGRNPANDVNLSPLLMQVPREP